MFPSSGEWRETPSLLGLLEKANINYWCTNISHTEEQQQHTKSWFANKLTTLTVTRNTPVTIIYQDNKYSKKQRVRCQSN
jgi:hypothetical protein